MSLPPHEDELIYCIEQGFPAEVTEALLWLITKPHLLAEAIHVWRKHLPDASDSDFRIAVYEVTGDECRFCHVRRCTTLFWEDDGVVVASGELVCEYCLENRYFRCDSCEEYVPGSFGTTIGRSTYCEPCVEERFDWCEDCEQYFHVDDCHEHKNDCHCEAPHKKFKFPANGHTFIREDERLTIELPKGVIDDVGLKNIKEYLYQERHQISGLDWHYIERTVDTIGPIWQMKRGNWPKRLAREFAVLGIKLPPGALSKVGNLARLHSSEGATWHVEFTRELNAPPEEFCHEESCWWSSYHRSRCALKSWGGLGMRSYDDPEDETCYPSGRIWVQPLRLAESPYNEDMKLRPTHDAFQAAAFVVFNGYGDLEGYVAARIVAHLTSKTYKKIRLSSDEQYINNGTGFLVADEELCENTTGLYFPYGEHDQQDADEFHTLIGAK